MLQAGTRTLLVPRPRDRVQSPNQAPREVWVQVKKKRHTRVPILLLSGFVTVRIGLKGDGINDSLVVHQLVTLVVRTSFQLVLASQSALLVGVGALGRSLQRTFGHFFLGTSSTEWKGEFTLMAVRQHGMVQFTRGEDSALDDPKVDADVGVRMSFGVHTGFVDPRVQGGVVDVMDLLTRGHTMVQFDCIGTTPTEGVTRVERVDELQGIHVRLNVGRGFFEASPFASPHFHHFVP